MKKRVQCDSHRESIYARKPFQDLIPPDSWGGRSSSVPLKHETLSAEIALAITEAFAFTKRRKVDSNTLTIWHPEFGLVLDCGKPTENTEAFAKWMKETDAPRKD